MVNSSRFASDTRIDKPWRSTLREKLPRSLCLWYVNWGSKECQDGGAVVEHCGKYTVGHGVGRGSHPGHRPRPCGDRAGALTAPAGGVVVAVGCTVFQMWRGGVPWALQARVLYICAPAVVGHVAVPAPLSGVLARALRGSGSHVEVPDPSRGVGGPDLRLLVLSIPPWGTRGDAGSLPE